MDCYISSQIKEYVNAEESICPECGGNMYHEDGETDLVCECCGEVVDMESDPYA